MAWIIGSVLAIVGLALLVVAALAIIMAIIELMIRVALAAALAGIVGCIGGIAVAQGGSDGIVAGVVVALFAFVPTLSSVWRWRSSATNRPVGRRSRQRRVLKVAPEIQIERKLGLTDAERLSVAWDSASKLAPQRELLGPRNACARFLAAFEAEADCDPENVELAVFIRRHVPSVVEETQAVLQDAAPDEREALVEGLVADLKQLGQEASDVSERLSAMARERLDIRRRHFAKRREVQGVWREAVRTQQVAHHQL